MKKIYLLTVLFVLCFSLLQAQDNTLYQLSLLSQSTLQTNPANASACKTHFSGVLNFPLLPAAVLPPNLSIMIQEPWKWSKVFEINPDRGDSLFFNGANFKKPLKPVNYINQNFQFDIIGFGSRGSTWSWAFNWGIRQQAQMYFPYVKQLNFDTVTKKPIPLKLDRLGMDFVAYNEFALNFSRDIASGWRIGFTPKLLIGFANVNTRNLQLNWETLSADSGYVWNIKFDGQVLGSPLNPTVADAIKNNDYAGLTEDYTSDIVGRMNLGVAIDLGVSYQYENFNFNLSAIDIGKIRWKAYTGVASADFSYKVEGGDLTLAEGERFVSDSLNGMFTKVFNDIQDSLTNLATTALKEGEAYSTWLPAKSYFNAQYEALPWLTVNLSNRMMYWNKQYRPDFSLGVTLKRRQSAQFTVNYSYLNRSWNHVGAGFVLRAGPFQWYMMTDDVIAFITPYYANNVSLRMGCNAVFGCRQKIDLPLID